MTNASTRKITISMKSLSRFTQQLLTAAGFGVALHAYESNILKTLGTAEQGHAIPVMALEKTAPVATPVDNDATAFDRIAPAAAPTKQPKAPFKAEEVQLYPTVATFRVTVGSDVINAPAPAHLRGAAVLTATK